MGAIPGRAGTIENQEFGLDGLSLTYLAEMSRRQLIHKTGVQGKSLLKKVEIWELSPYRQLRFTCPDPQELLLMSH